MGKSKASKRAASHEEKKPRRPSAMNGKKTSPGKKGSNHCFKMQNKLNGHTKYSTFQATSKSKTSSFNKNRGHIAIHTNNAPPVASVKQSTESISTSSNDLLLLALWYEAVSQVEGDVIKDAGAQAANAQKHNPITFANIQELSKSLLTKFCETHQMSINAEFHELSVDGGMSGATAKGMTSSDRISALAVATEKNALVNHSYLVKLLNIANKSNVTEKLKAMRALTDLFAFSILPNRKLRYFEVKCKEWQTANHGGYQFIVSNLEYRDSKLQIKNEETNQRICNLLMLWAFEDVIKTIFASFSKVLATTLQDTVYHAKSKALHCIYELLSEKPEQEQLFMERIVGKLSDSTAKMSAEASSLLVKVIERHPIMKKTVFQYIQNSIMMCLSKLDYAKITGKITSKKISDFTASFQPIFRSLLFVSELKFKRSEKELAAEVLGMYLNIFNILFDDQHSTNRNTLRQYLYVNQNVNRVVRVLLNGLNRAFPYIMDSAIGESSALEKIQQKVETLYKAIHIIPVFSSKIVVLNLLFKILQCLQNPLDRYHRVLYDKLSDLALYKSKNAVSLFSLVYSSAYCNFNACRSLSIMKRLLQRTINLEPPAVCIVSLKLCKAMIDVKPLDSSVVTSEECKLQANEEHFIDAEEDSESGENRDERKMKEQTPDSAKYCVYAPTKRDPRYTKADESHFWESLFCTTSYHPTTSFEANLLRNSIKAPSTPITYQADTAQLTSQFTDCMQLYNSAAVLEYICVNLSDPRAAEAMLSDKKQEEPIVQKGALQKESKVQPHEEWVALYHKDPFVIRKREVMLNEESAGSKQLPGELDLDGMNSEEEEDAFADNLFENELKTADGDDDFSEDEEMENDSDDGEMSETDHEIDEGEIGEDDGIKEYEAPLQIIQTNKKRKKNNSYKSTMVAKPPKNKNRSAGKLRGKKSEH